MEEVNIMVDTGKQNPFETTEGSRIVTDSAFICNNLNDKFWHKIVNYSISEYTKGDLNTNTLEGLFCHLKRGIIGKYHQTSQKHLEKYCNEFSFRYNTRKFKEVERFDIAIRQSKGSLTYDNLIKKID